MYGGKISLLAYVHISLTFCRPRNIYDVYYMIQHYLAPISNPSALCPFISLLHQRNKAFGRSTKNVVTERMFDPRSGPPNKRARLTGFKPSPYRSGPRRRRNSSTARWRRRVARMREIASAARSSRAWGSIPRGRRSALACVVGVHVSSVATFRFFLPPPLVTCTMAQLSEAPLSTSTSTTSLPCRRPQSR